MSGIILVKSCKKRFFNTGSITLKKHPDISSDSSDKAPESNGSEYRS